MLQLAAVSFLTMFSSTFAQSDLRVSVADMKQDLAALIQEVKALRLELDQVRYEQARLSAAKSGDRTQAELSRLSATIDAVGKAYRLADERQKQTILAEANRQIEALAKQTQAALDALAKTGASQPVTPAPIHFSEDYPKTGKPYVVRSGDTLSKIARDHGSKVKDIQNANKIANPSRDLQIGQTIFIPIAQ